MACVQAISRVPGGVRGPVTLERHRWWGIRLVATIVVSTSAKCSLQARARSRGRWLRVCPCWPLAWWAPGPLYSLAGACCSLECTQLLGHRLARRNRHTTGWFCQMYLVPRGRMSEICSLHCPCPCRRRPASADRWSWVRVAYELARREVWWYEVQPSRHRQLPRYRDPRHNSRRLWTPT